MPIIEITDTHAVQRCASCDQCRELTVDDLRPTEGDEAILSLPTCPCGALEFLIGATDDEPEYPAPGTFGHQHRLVVNALVHVATHRADDGDASSLGNIVAERIGAKALGEWFPHGLRLQPRETTSDAPERIANKDQR